MEKFGHKDIDRMFEEALRPPGVDRVRPEEVLKNRIAKVIKKK
jgi:hypothetical protein